MIYRNSIKFLICLVIFYSKLHIASGKETKFSQVSLEKRCESLKKFFDKQKWLNSEYICEESNYGTKDDYSLFPDKSKNILIDIIDSRGEKQFEILGCFRMDDGYLQCEFLSDVNSFSVDKFKKNKVLSGFAKKFGISRVKKEIAKIKHFLGKKKNNPMIYGLSYKEFLKSLVGNTYTLNFLSAIKADVKFLSLGKKGRFKISFPGLSKGFLGIGEGKLDLKRLKFEDCISKSCLEKNTTIEFFNLNASFQLRQKISGKMRHIEEASWKINGTDPASWISLGEDSSGFEEEKYY